MRSLPSLKFFLAALACAGIMFTTGLDQPAQAQNQSPSSETTSLIVMVKDSDSGNPIDQAHLTLQFVQPAGAAMFKKSKKVSYSAKTNMQGRYKFLNINKGEISLFVTAQGHQSFGKKYTLETENQVFEIKLKKPQPLI